MPSTTRLPSTRATPFNSPIRLRSRRTVASISTTSPGENRTAVAHALDAREEDEALPVLRLRENQDRADLRDRLGQDRRRQHRRAVRGVRQIALVERHVLDADDPLVDLELGDAVDEAGTDSGAGRIRSIAA